MLMYQRVDAKAMALAVKHAEAREELAVAKQKVGGFFLDYQRNRRHLPIPMPISMPFLHGVK